MTPPLCGADHVLVVDDEQFSRQIVMRFLRELGAPQIHAAGDGAQALEILATIPARLVITDVNMPGRNGLDLLKAIRTSGGFIRHDMPVLMLTGLADRALVGAAVALDVDAFVVKPVSKAALESRIRHALGDERDIKPAAEYAKVDVAAATAHLFKPETLVPPAAPAAPRRPAGAPNARRVRVDALLPGAVLAEDVRAPTGELLLASGAALNARLIGRLRDLAAMNLNMDGVWVQAPPA